LLSSDVNVALRTQPLSFPEFQDTKALRPIPKSAGFLGKAISTGRRLTKPAVTRIVGGVLVPEGLADAVNLIIVTPVREAEELVLKIPEPGRLVRKQHQPRFEFRGFDGHSNHLALFWLDGNGRQPRALQFRNESRVDAGILDQNLMRLVRLGMRDSARCAAAFCW
jgi:hypothetical protein